VELKKRLDRVSQLARPRDDTDGRRRLLVANFGLKLAAVLVACVAWFFIGFDAETVQKTFVVPIEYRNLSDKMDIDDSAPTEARVTLTGHERAFNLLAPSTLKVSLDLSDVAEGPQQIAIDESHVKLPSNLALFRSVPRVVSFGVHSWVKVRLAVEARTEGRLPRELRQREIQVVPGEVQVLIRRSFKSSTTHVSTEVINLGRMTDAVELKAKLVLPEHMRLEVGQPLQVSVMLEHSTDNADTANTPGGGGR
jgi:YbbR domain-containing protein